MADNYDTYLFTYRFAGAEWGFDIKAKSAEEAKERVKTLGAWARYDGILVARIPAALGLFARLAVVIRNALRSQP